jgi:hypothetical protein
MRLRSAAQIKDGTTHYKKGAGRPHEISSATPNKDGFTHYKKGAGKD